MRSSKSKPRKKANNMKFTNLPPTVLLISTFFLCSPTLVNAQAGYGVAGKRFFVAPFLEFMPTHSPNHKGETFNGTSSYDDFSYEGGPLTMNRRIGLNLGFHANRRITLVGSIAPTKTMNPIQESFEINGDYIYFAGLVKQSYINVKFGFERYTRWSSTGIGPYYGLLLGYQLVTSSKKLAFVHSYYDGLVAPNAQDEAEYQAYRYVIGDDTRLKTIPELYLRFGSKKYITPTLFYDFSLNFGTISFLNINEDTRRINRYETFNVCISVGKGF
jgi:hypothetical protein